MAETDFLANIRKKASERNKTIVLPESHDDRVLQAAEYLTKEKIASVTTIGNKDKILESAKRINVKMDSIQIVDQEKSDKLNEYGKIFYEMRKARGKEIPLEKAIETIKRDIFFGTQISKPVPCEHTLNRNDNVFPVWFNDFKK